MVQQSWSQRNQEFFWPDVSNPLNAERSIRYGFWAAAFVASVTATVALLAIFLHKPVLGVDGAGLVDAALFAGIAFGIDRRSRAAAVAGLALYGGERAHILAKGATTSAAAAMTVILALYFVHGVRGTFAYRKPEDKQKTPTAAG
ncbi:MAG: hypothetical protein WB711_10560 [Terriglobales bacterium]